MKAKSHYSGIIISATARGTICAAAVIAVFIGGFVVWSFAGSVVAVMDFLGSFH